MADQEDVTQRFPASFIDADVVPKGFFGNVRVPDQQELLNAM